MAGEFKHADVGQELTKAEWEGVATHIADGQTAGDILYFNGTSWIRLAKGTDGYYLKSGTAPSWEQHSDLTTGVHGVGAGTVAKVSDIVATKLDDFTAPDDNTDLNASTDKHGLVVKATAPAATYTNVVGISNGETAYTNKTLQDGNVPENQALGDSAATGSAAPLARRDHKHGMPSSNLAIAVITFVINEGGAVLSTGVKGYLEIPFACTITRATMLADVSGSAVVDIWKDTYANHPPTDADSITSSTPPTISSAVKSQDSTLTSWTTSIAAGDILAFNIDSCTTITKLTVSLRVTKTS